MGSLAGFASDHELSMAAFYPHLYGIVLYRINDAS